MATTTITVEGNSPRMKQLQRLMYALAFWVMVQARITSRSFYRGAYWRSLSLEVFKILVLFMVVVMNVTRPGSKDGAYSNLMSLKMGILGLTMSVLTDMAFTQMRY